AGVRRRPRGRVGRASGGTARARPRRAGAVQGAARRAVRDGAAQDRERQAGPPRAAGDRAGGSTDMSPFRASAGFTDEWKHFGLDISDGVATVTFTRPDKLNALTFDVYADLRDLLAELPHRGDARVVVLAGQGRGFCSGGDVEEIIGELQRMDAAGLLEFTRMTGAVTKALRECPLPVIAAVNGVAAGAGSVLALASDFR